MRLRNIIIALAALVSLDASAGLVLDRTRIIYPEGAGYINLMIKNPDGFSSIAQVWMDKDDPTSSPGSVNADEVPFFITPPVSRVESGKGQTVRVSYTGMDLPNDRESVFYLNLLQIPPKGDLNGAVNSLVILLRTRIKVFYRPKGLLKDSGYVVDSLSFKADSSGIMVVNPTPYYASFSDAYVVSGSVRRKLDFEMIPPYSEILWAVKGGSSAGDMVEASFVNDYGAKISLNRSVSR